MKQNQNNAKKKRPSENTQSVTDHKKPLSPILAQLLGSGLVILGIYFFVALVFNTGGIIGYAVRNILLGFFGFGGFLLPVLLIYSGILAFLEEKVRAIHLIGGFLFIICFGVYLALFFGFEDGFNLFTPESKSSFTNLYNDGISLVGGGAVSGSMAIIFSQLFSRIGTAIIFIFFALTSLVMTTGIPLKQILSFFIIKRNTYDDNEYEEEELIEKQMSKSVRILKTEKAKFTSDLDRSNLNVDIPLGSKDAGIKSPGKYKLSSALNFDKFFKSKPSEQEAENDDPQYITSIEDIVKAKETPVIFGKVDEESLNSRKGAGTKPKIDETAISELGGAMRELPPLYTYPPVTLLKRDPPPSGADINEELKQNATKLISTLESFGVSAKIVNVTRGPAVTRYEISPGSGIKVNKITSLADDIALSLAAMGVRIEAPIPGKSAIGIEVPNKLVSIVNIRNIIDSEAFENSSAILSVALGEDISGNEIIADLSKMPHLLIAGSTGSGKSICVNSIITSILFKASPEQVRFVMIDPKVVELSIYNGIPHLLVPVVTDAKKAAGALAWAVTEMLNRYKTFAIYNCRDIDNYNSLAMEKPEIIKMPRIVILIDELADLMMVAPNEVEESICRLAQMARAAGMHLVVATQRPSVNVITGIIKANIPSRIAFAVSSQIDSRIIIDINGAERLLGRGDMLYLPLGAQKPRRLQGSFVSDKEVEALVKFVKNENAQYDEDIISQIESQIPGKRSNEPDVDDEDSMLNDAINVVVDAGSASTSLLQRRLKLGYGRAARIIDQMEKKGIVGPFEGSKPRAVLLSRQSWLERQLGNDTDINKGSQHSENTESVPVSAQISEE